MTGCSLIKVDLGGEALSRTEMNARLSAHAFADEFSRGVAMTADSIIGLTESRAIHMDALRWKIFGTGAIRTPAFEPHPYGSFIDCWTVAVQMRQFFETGAGRALFGPHQGLVVESARHLEQGAEDIVSNYRKPEEVARFREFVTAFAASHPFHDITFGRQSSLDSFLVFMDVPDSLRLQTVGTLPQVVTKYSSGVTLLTDQLPRQLQWGSELFVLSKELDKMDLRRRMDTLSMYIDRITRVVEASPDVLKGVSAELGASLLPVIEMLRQERELITGFLQEERGILGGMVKSERAIIMSSLEATGLMMVEDVMERSKVHVRTFVFGAVVLLVLLFTFPFVFGYFTGRSVSRARRTEA